MPKVKTSLVIIGIIVAMLAASILTLLGLFLAGVIVKEKPVLEFSVDAVVEREYDGTPLKAENFSWVSGKNELKAGHEVEGLILGEQTDCGVSETDLRITVYDKKGHDVTNEYSIKVNNTDLIVTPRKITIILLSQQVPYSGDEVMLDNYLVLEGATDFDSSGQTTIDLSKLPPKELASGDRLAVSFPGFMNVVDELPDYTNWTRDNFKLYNEKGERINDNYQLTWGALGTIEIVPRKLGVKALSAGKLYDGSPIEASYQHVWGSLVGNDFIQGVRFVDEQNNEVDPNRLITVQDKKVKISELILYKQEGNGVVQLSEDEAKNYEIDEDCNEFATLSIQKRTIEVQAKDIIKEYDGFGLLYSWDGEDKFYTVSGLPSQFELTATNKDAEKIIDVYDGTYSMNAFTITRNNQDVTDQFEIISRSAIARITPIMIRSFLSPCKDTYTGNEINISVSDAVGTALNEDITNYVQNHAGTKQDIKDVLTELINAERYFQVVCTQTVKNAGDYIFTLELNSEGKLLFDSEGDIVFEFNSAKMTVERAAITAEYYGLNGKTQSVSKYYDGTEYNFDYRNLYIAAKDNLSVSSAEFRYVSGNTADTRDHSLFGSYTVSVQNVHITLYHAEEKVYEDVTENYQITAPTLAVSIEKATLYATASQTYVYYEVADLSQNVFNFRTNLADELRSSVTFVGLASGDNVSYDVSNGFYLDANGSNYSDTITFSVSFDSPYTVTNSNGEDVRDCYYFANEYETIITVFLVVKA